MLLKKPNIPNFFSLFSSSLFCFACKDPKIFFIILLELLAILFVVKLLTIFCTSPLFVDTFALLNPTILFEDLEITEDPKEFLPESDPKEDFGFLFPIIFSGLSRDLTITLLCL